MRFRPDIQLSSSHSAGKSWSGTQLIHEENACVGGVGVAKGTILDASDENKSAKS